MDVDAAVLCVRNNAVRRENEQLKLQLAERERSLCHVQRSMSLLHHRLSVLAVKPSDLTMDLLYQRAGTGQRQLDSLNQVIHKIARKVFSWFLHFVLLLIFVSSGHSGTI